MGANIILFIVLLIVVFRCKQSEPPLNVQPLAFIHVTVINVEKGDLMQDQTVVVYGNKITAIGKSGSVEVPSGSKLIDASGKFLIPGLWDAHVHLSQSGACTLPVLVANGITSV